MKKIIVWILTAALLVMSCGAALAATGDRALLRYNTQDGYMISYINTILQTKDGLIVILNGNEQKILRYTDLNGEPEEFTEEKDEDGNSLGYWGDGVTNTQTAGWFAYQGEVYALQYEQTYDGESSSIEGGFVKKLKLEDGKIKLEECDLPRMDWSNMIEESGDYTGSRWLSKVYTTGDLLASMTYDNNGQSVIILFDLTTGDSEEVSVYDAYDVYQGPEGSVLTMRYEWGENGTTVHVLKISLPDGDEEELAELEINDGNIYTLNYDEETDTLYYVLNGQIWAMKDRNPENAATVNDCPLNGVDSTLLLPDNRMLLWTQSAAVIRNLDPSQKADFTLMIQDMAYSDSFGDTVFDFADARGDASVVLQRSGDPTSILQAMMNRDAQVDIYTLNYQSSEFEALKNRGFLADLGINDELKAEMNRMYPFLQKALVQDGKIIGVPAGMYGSALEYRTDIWEKLGKKAEDLPKTWDQFFDWLETLPELLEANDLALVETWTNRENFRYSLMQMILQQYQEYLAAEGMEYAFNTPILKKLMERLDAVNYDALGISDASYDEDGGFYMGDDEYKEPLIDFWGTVTMPSWNNNMKILPLSFEEGKDPILPVTMTVAFVNPYSEHAEAAAQFLALSLKNLPLATRYSIYADLTEPLRYPDFEEYKENMAKWAEEAKEMAEKAETEEEKEAWEETAKNYAESLADLDNTYWMFSPSAIQEYQERAPWLCPISYDFAMSMVSDGTDSYYDTLNAYAAGQMSAEEFLSGIDKKVQMMRLEGN